MKENAAIPFFSETHLQNFCNRCYTPAFWY